MTGRDEFVQKFEVQGRNFSRAGTVSTEIKEILKEIGIDPHIIRRASIAAYEAEMNVVMYAELAEVTLRLDPHGIFLRFDDRGRGIENIEMAMQEGFSTATDEMREMGFGAGMGLPNIKKNADRFEIASEPGQGTTLQIFFDLDEGS